MRPHRRIRFLLAGLLALSLPSVHSLAPVLVAAATIGAFSAGSIYASTFASLGDLPGGDVQSRATNVSANGEFVIGYSAIRRCDYCPFPDQQYDGFIWSEASGLRSLGGPQACFNTIPGSVSGDGSVVVGYCEPPFNAVLPINTSPFIWTETIGARRLPELANARSCRARVVTRDGGTAYGNCRRGSRTIIAVRWSAADDWQISELGVEGGVADVSVDEQVVGGVYLPGEGDSLVLHPHPYRWTAQIGLQPFPLLLGARRGTATATSEDGSVVVGWIDTYDLSFVFRWTQETGMELLEPLRGLPRNWATGISGDGSIILGGSAPEQGQPSEAFVWTATHGTRSLLEILQEDPVVALEGWRSVEVRAISADGRTVVGSGYNLEGVREGWVATLDELAILACEDRGGDTDGDGLCDDEDPCKFFANSLPLVRSAISGIPCECLCGDFDGDCFHSMTDAATINECASFVRFDCVSERDEVDGRIDGFYSATDASLVDRAAASIDPAYTLTCQRRPEGTCSEAAGVSCDF